MTLRPWIRGVIVISQTPIDTTEIEEARFRLLQCNHVSQRVLRHLKTVDTHAMPSLGQVEHGRALAQLQTALAITEPSWVATAPHFHLLQVLDYIGNPATAS
jgi:hypothetical protein